MHISSRTVIVALLMVCLTGSFMLTAQAKKAPRMKIESIKNFAVLPFISTSETETEKKTGPIAADAFANVLQKKRKYTIMAPEKAGELLRAEGIEPHALSNPEIAKKACAILKVDAILVGRILLYIEKERSSEHRENNPSGMSGGAGSGDLSSSDSGFTENLREVKSEFELTVYRASDGGEAGTMKLKRTIRDTAKDPMMPSSGEVLLERCAKWSAKKLAKRLPK